MASTHWRVSYINRKASLWFKTSPGMRTLDRKFNRLPQSDLPSHPIKRFTHQRCLFLGPQTVIRDICLYLISICYRWAAEGFRDIIWVLRSGGSACHKGCSCMNWQKGVLGDSKIPIDLIAEGSWKLVGNRPKWAYYWPVNTLSWDKTSTNLRLHVPNWL